MKSVRSAASDGLMGSHRLVQCPLLHGAKFFEAASTSIPKGIIESASNQFQKHCPVVLSYSPSLASVSPFIMESGQDLNLSSLGQSGNTKIGSSLDPSMQFCNSQFDLSMDPFIQYNDDSMPLTQPSTNLVNGQSLMPSSMGGSWNPTYSYPHQAQPFPGAGTAMVPPTWALQQDYEPSAHPQPGPRDTTANSKPTTSQPAVVALPLDSPTTRKRKRSLDAGAPLVTNKRHQPNNASAKPDPAQKHCSPTPAHSSSTPAQSSPPGEDIMDASDTTLLQLLADDSPLIAEAKAMATRGGVSLPSFAFLSTFISRYHITRRVFLTSGVWSLLLGEGLSLSHYRVCISKVAGLLKIIEAARSRSPKYRSRVQSWAKAVRQPCDADSAHMFKLRPSEALRQAISWVTGPVSYGQVKTVDFPGGCCKITGTRNKSKIVTWSPEPEVVMDDAEGA